MGKRQAPVFKSHEDVIASLLADGLLTEDDITEMVAQAAVDEARALMRKQRLAACQTPTAPKPQRAKKTALPKPAISEPFTPAPPKPAPQPAKTRYHVRNWKAYNQALVNRGSLTLWFDAESIRAWKNEDKNGKVGRDYTFADCAILTMLTLKAVFHLPLRATEGVTRSIVQLAQISLPIPNYSTLSRRACRLEVRLPRARSGEGVHVVVDSSGLKVYGEGEWKVRKHGWSKRRTWSRIHIGVNESSQELLACVVRGNDVSDSEALPEVLEEVDEPLEQVSGDGAYDTQGCYGAIEQRGARAIIPPREHAVVNCGVEWAARNATLERIAEIGRTAWKVETKYHRRSLSETAFSRLKRIFGERLSSRTEEGRTTEGRIWCRALNRMTQLGLPDSYEVAAS